MTTNPFFKACSTMLLTPQLFFIILALFTTSYIGAQENNDDRVMLQGFYWESAANNPNNWYNIVNNLSQDISDMGIDLIWLPPPSDAGSLEGYLPRELNNFANNYGSEQAHIDLLSALNSKGIEPIADIVINHRVGSTNYVDFTNPTWGTDAITSNDEVWGVPEYFNTFPRGNNDTGTPYEAARDIDHTKTYVQNSIIGFLNNLKNIGYKGWRYDFVHGFDPYYFKLYNGATNPTFSVGENFNSNKQVIQDWIDNTESGAFDFPTYFTLKSVIRDNNYSYLANNGEPSGGIGWDPKNNTTFVENHDTPRYDTPNNVLNAGNVVQTYAYLLTHPGVPCIYWPHLFDWGDTVKGEISNLIRIRKAAGVHSQSNTKIETAQNGLYAATISGTNYDVAMKIGPNDWSPSGSNWTLSASGNNYAVWTNQSSTGNDTDNDSESFQVYTQGYSSVYSWDNNLNPTSGSWPGANLNDEGNGWYSATIQGSCSNIIFSNNGGNQTADLYTCSNEPYFYDNSWHASPPGGNSTSFDIYVKDFTHVYTWNNNLEQTNGSWPGTVLSSADNGYRTITINGDCSNVIFSYNGGGQTADLSTCANEPYFYDNSWHSGPQGNSRLAEIALSSQLRIYPNPMKDNALIDLNIVNDSSLVTAKIINLNGQSISLYSNTLPKGKHTIAINRNELRLDSGLYFLRLEVNGETVNKKISIE